MINDGKMSSKSHMWETPQWLFDKLDAVWQFSLDVCATPENAKCKHFITPDVDALRDDVHWHGTCWMNPPYGRQIGLWVKKAYESAQGGASVVCLLPARTDTAWWHDYCMKGNITFLRGRLKFSDSKGNAPFPSALVAFTPHGIRPAQHDPAQSAADAHEDAWEYPDEHHRRRYSGLIEEEYG